jgi:FAD synthetase
MIQNSSEYRDAAAAAVVNKAKAAQNGHPTEPHCAMSNRSSFRDVCFELRDKVEAFLAEEQKTTLLRDVQAQVRVSIGVVEEALDKYRYVILGYLCEIGGGWIADRAGV